MEVFSLSVNEKGHRRHYWMTFVSEVGTEILSKRQVFKYLLQLIVSFTQREDTELRKSVSPKEQLGPTLRFLVAGWNELPLFFIFLSSRKYWDLNENAFFSKPEISQLSTDEISFSALLRLISEADKREKFRRPFILILKFSQYVGQHVGF
jgi:hypothetical protein